MNNMTGEELSIYKVRVSEFEFRDPTESELEVISRTERLRKKVAIGSLLFMIIVGGMIFFRVRDLLSNAPDQFSMVFAGGLIIIFGSMFIAVLSALLGSMDYEVCDVEITGISSRENYYTVNIWSEAQQRYATNVPAVSFVPANGQKVLLVKKVKKIVKVKAYTVMDPAWRGPLGIRRQADE